jgi:hypothetical protein
MKFSCRRLGFVGALLLGCGDSFACGPFFPETLLNEDRATLRPPIVNFEDEVRRIQSPSPAPAVTARITPEPDRAPRYSETAILDAESAELAEILADKPEAERAAAVADYRGIRQAMLRKYSSDPRYYNPGDPTTNDYLRLADIQLGKWPAWMPPDIRLYLEGALAYHYGDKPGAIAIWKKLLALPEAERPNRSVAAAWMIAKATREGEGLATALPWYEKCAEFSAAGQRDCLRLGLASLGWQARLKLDQGDLRAAQELYYHEAIAGDSGAWVSLLRTMPDLTKLSDEQVLALAKDPFQRGLITAELLRDTFQWQPVAAKPTPGESTRWLDALEKANASDLSEAGTFAELAYSSARFDDSERWIHRARKDDPRALWIQGKLALMKGDTKRAEKFLTAAKAAFPRQEESSGQYAITAWESFSQLPEKTAVDFRTSQFYGDLGATHLARDHYFDALTALYRADFRMDAAYVAERILSREELLEYVRKHFPHPAKTVPAYGRFAFEDFGGGDVRYLLARRLARDRYFKDARPFLPEPLMPVFDRYVTLFRKSRSSENSSMDRSAALWEVAQIHRSLGLELFGTEIEPDFLIEGGQFGGGSTMAGDRLGPPFKKSSWRGEITIIPAPTSEEKHRVLRNRMPHEERFQYRYVAADLAWKAAQRMPDNSEETARVLGIAGSWLKDRDPKAADKFYKAMIWRNWSTPLAREADAKRWFPDIEWTYDPFAAANTPRPEGL